jgi:hypothetical protein
MPATLAAMSSSASVDVIERHGRRLGSTGREHAFRLTPNSSRRTLRGMSRRIL